jgi:hypothetical protein
MALICISDAMRTEGEKKLPLLHKYLATIFAEGRGAVERANRRGLNMGFPKGEPST